MFHSARPRDKNDHNLNCCCKSCLQVLDYNVKSVAFCCGAIDIPGFDPRNGAKVALATVRIWLESNDVSINHVIFHTYESAGQEIYKDLISNVYFPVSKYYLANIYMKENPNTDYIVNVKSDEISNELGQNLSGLQIYPNFAQNIESESVAETSKRITRKVNFNAIKDLNILLGLMNYGENVCFLNPVIKVLYSLPLIRDYISKLRPPLKGVAMKIRNFSVKWRL